MGRSYQAGRKIRVKGLETTFGGLSASYTELEEVQPIPFPRGTKFKGLSPLKLCWTIADRIPAPRMSAHADGGPIAELRYRWPEAGNARGGVVA